MRILVIYYSRTGVTRSVAEAVSQALSERDGVDVATEELKEPVDRSGFLGYLRSGFDAMRKKQATIEPIGMDPWSFDVVVVGTPVWAFKVSPPVRTFLARKADRMKNTAFFCTMGGSGEKGTFREMEALCGCAPLAKMALREKDVKSGDEENFRAKVREFADTVAGSERPAE